MPLFRVMKNSAVTAVGSLRCSGEGVDDGFVLLRGSQVVGRNRSSKRAGREFKGAFPFRGEHTIGERPQRALPLLEAWTC
jgi:hypothetical protein